MVFCWRSPLLFRETRRTGTFEAAELSATESTSGSSGKALDTKRMEAGRDAGIQSGFRPSRGDCDHSRVPQDELKPLLGIKNIRVARKSAVGACPNTIDDGT